MEQFYSHLYATSVPRFTNLLLMEGSNIERSETISREWKRINFSLNVSLIDKLILLSISNNSMLISGYSQNLLSYTIQDLMNMSKDEIINYFILLYYDNCSVLFLNLLNNVLSNFPISNMLDNVHLNKLQEQISIILEVFTPSLNTQQNNVDDRRGRANLSVKCMERLEKSYQNKQ